MRRPSLSMLLFLLAACGKAEKSVVPASRLPAPKPVAGASADFNRDVRPILSDRCFGCHGPDAGKGQKAGLRLDTAEGARAVLKSGKRAVVPGDLAASEMARRIASREADEIMPPHELNRPLTAAEKDVLVRWIAQGAEYKRHWAYAPVAAAPAPAVKDAAWPRDDLDRFVLAKLEGRGLAPAPEADKATLLRRATLALTGLPPTPGETDAFLADAAPDAYEKRVDALLASPRYGERMAADWLDVARFADTFGYQADFENQLWPWRDWVIAAFNANQPYDAFLRDQLAGDLLPGATKAQITATAFCRLHRETNEGGSIEEEFRQEYINDRVVTFGVAVLGLTFDCARCHDHKYDPIPQTDFYGLCAFFGAIDEGGLYPFSNRQTPAPALRLSTDAQDAQIAGLRAAVAQAEARLAQAGAGAAGAPFRAWLAGHPAPEAPKPVAANALAGKADGPGGGAATAFNGDDPVHVQAPSFGRDSAYAVAVAVRLPEDPKPRMVLMHTTPNFTCSADAQGWQLLLKDGHLHFEIVHNWPGSAIAIRTREPVDLKAWRHVALTYDGSSTAAGMRLYLDGRPADCETTYDHLDGAADAGGLQLGARSRDAGFTGGLMADLRLFDRELAPAEVAGLVDPGALAQAVRAGGDGALAVYLASHDPAVAAGRAQVAAARGALHDFERRIPELMVMRRSERPRPTYVLTRGQYDQPDLSRPVKADHACDAVFPYAGDLPRDRLGLARWTTDPANPLPARVEVNRLWAACFGRGIVATQENFGLQGDPPSDQELLDTLAHDFVAGGWDVKATMRRLVLSATFRQASAATPDKLEKDPQNALLSRGPSFRLPAEMLRDQALAASGLIAEQVGGPSVKPWQPAGLWEDAGASGGAYHPDSGAAAHRRSLYTFRKRTAPPPNMLLLDAGSRETCLARRQPTNTPLQPLVFLNDRVFFECAQALARRSAKEAGGPGPAALARAFRLLAGRAPRETEVETLQSLFDGQAQAYANDTAEATKVCGDPDPRLAALTLVCSTLMASDAVVTSR